MKLKLELEFDSEAELLKVSQAINDAVNGNFKPPLSTVVPMSGTATPPVFNDEDVVEEPSVHVGTETVVENTPEVHDADNEQPAVPATKRRRKSKAEPVAKAPSVLDTAGEVLTDEERKANTKAVAAQMEKNVAGTVEEALTQTPKNFYSLTDFLNNFAVILNNLVKDSTLTHRSLQDYCAQFGVPFIYALSKDKKKLEAFFNQLVAEGHITKKGDY
jgi:hypothetical protein